MKIDKRENRERAERARRALDAYVGAFADDNDLETGATDLVCDLLHLVNAERKRNDKIRSAEDANDVLNRGLRHFEAEALDGEYL